MLKIKWPVALATMFLVLLGWYLVYTESIVRAPEDNADRLSAIYPEVQAGLATMDQSAAITAMFNLQGIIIESGVPLVITGPGGLATAFENLDFEELQASVESLQYAASSHLNRIKTLAEVDGSDSAGEG